MTSGQEHVYNAVESKEKHEQMNAKRTQIPDVYCQTKLIKQAKIIFLDLRLSSLFLPCCSCSLLAVFAHSAGASRVCKRAAK